LQKLREVSLFSLQEGQRRHASVLGRSGKAADGVADAAGTSSVGTSSVDGAETPAPADAPVSFCVVGGEAGEAATGLALNSR